MEWILSIHHNKCNFQIQQKDWVGAAIISDKSSLRWMI